MNYTQLSAQIKAFCENTFPSTTGGVSSDDQVAQFVRNAEQKVYNSIQFPALRKNSTGTLTSGNKYLAAPSDFLSVYSLAVIDASDDYYYLLNKDVNFIREAYPNSVSGAGLPKYYSIFGPATTSTPPITPTNELTFILGPTPDDDYSVELHYFYYPESIVDAGTSWLGDNFDTVLFYGSLVEAYVYMKGEQDITAMYQQKYDEALAIAKQLGDGKNRQDAYRSVQVRVPIR